MLLRVRACALPTFSHVAFMCVCVWSLGSWELDRGANSFTIENLIVSIFVRTLVAIEYVCGAGACSYAA